jgi:hypothetical protein
MDVARAFTSSDQFHTSDDDSAKAEGIADFVGAVGWDTVNGADSGDCMLTTNRRLYATDSLPTNPLRRRHR